MNITKLYEITPNDKLMNSLGLAIAEAKMTRSLLRAEETSYYTARDNGRLEKLNELNREIDYLEAKLIEVRSKVNRGESRESANPEFA